LSLTFLLTAGCANAPIWQAPGEVLITEQAITLALNDLEGGSYTNDFESDVIPDIPAPKALRPCCAFGNGLMVKLGEIPLVIFIKSDITNPIVGFHTPVETDSTRQFWQFKPKLSAY
jgi:hypothetical protein